MNSPPARLDALPRDRQIAVICHYGARSFHVARCFEQSGFVRVINLAGGINAWAKEVDPTVLTC